MRRSLDEIARELVENGGGLQRQPLLVRSPVNRGFPLRGPFSGTRSFGSLSIQKPAIGALRSVRYASSFSILKNSGMNRFRFQTLSFIGTHSIPRGTFPYTLYSNFSGSQGVPLRTTNQCINLMKKSLKAYFTQSKTAFPIATQLHHHSTEYLNQVLNLARITPLLDNCVVSFEIPRFQTSLPGMTFMDASVLQDFAKEVKLTNEKVSRILTDLTSISDTFGSLPVSFKDNIIKVFFTNCDKVKTEMLLRDLGVTTGVIQEDSRVPELSRVSSIVSLSDILSSSPLGLEYSPSSQAESAILTDDFFPIVDENSSIFNNSQNWV